MNCTDPILTALKEQGYNIVRLPRAEIHPLQILSRTKTNLDLLGPISDLMSGADLPPIRLDEPSAPVSDNKTKTNSIDSKVGIGFLGSIVQAFGGKTAGLDGKYKGTGNVTFEFLGVTRDSIEITKLDQYLVRSTVNPDARYARKLLENDGLYILTAVLKSKKIKVESHTTGGGSIGVDASQLQGIVGGNVTITTESKDDSSIVYEGEQPLVFAFQAVRVRSRSGKYDDLEVVDAGAVAMKGLDDEPSVAMGEFAAKGSDNLIVFDTRRSPFVRVEAAEDTTESEGEGEAEATRGDQPEEAPAAPIAARSAIGRKALLIGINVYANLPPPYNRLNGCVNDVLAMKLTLGSQFGFAESDIEVLLDDKAKRDDILAAFDRLVDRTSSGDLVVIHYSGHGSQVPDLEGDESDGFDETIIPHDSGRVDKPNRDVTDDEIYERLRRLSAKTDAITLIFDCCHSGTITRDAFGELSRWVEPDLRSEQDSGRPKPSVSPETIAELKGLQAKSAQGTSRDVGPTSFVPLDSSYVLIAGCTDEERSFEYKARGTGGDVRHGALSYFLLQEIAKAPQGSTYRDVFEKAASQVTTTYSNQHPQIEGAADRELFGSRNFVPMRHVLVTAVKANKITLAAGSAQGVTVGSTYAVYEQGVKQVGPSTKRLGLVKITAARGLSSDAEPVDVPDLAAIVPNCRAVEEDHVLPPMVQVAEVVDRTGRPEVLQAVETIKGRLAHSNSLSLAGSGSGEPTIRAYALPAGKLEDRAGAVPTLGTIAKPCWATVGLDGQLLTSTFPIDDPGSIDRLVENLETIARYRNVLAIRNPDPINPMAGGKVDLRLLRQNPDQTWSEAAPGEDGQVVFHEGDALGLRLINMTGKPVFATVLDFGLSHAISALFPPNGSTPMLTVPCYDTTTPDGYDISLSFPTNFVGDQGIETIKLIATSQRTDFTVLSQAGTKSVDLSRGGMTGLDQLLGMASDGTRDGAIIQVRSKENWLTLERPFILKRRAAPML
jgi:Caspase domain